MSRGQWAVGAKFTRPLPGPGFTPLARVQDVLMAASSVVLVEAPAGFGKTSHVSAWVGAASAERATPYAWLSLDPGDADPVTFVQSLAATVARAWPGLRLPVRPRPLRARAAWYDLGRQLAAGVAALGPFVIVLDDLHELSAGADDRSIALLEGFALSLSPEVRLILSGREAPLALPVVRWQAGERLVRLGVDALRLEALDVQRLLEEEIGRVPADWGERLGTATGGWPMLIRLAVRHLSGQTPGERDLDSLLAREDDLYRYLAVESLDRRPTDERHGLLVLSLPEQVDPGVMNVLLPDAPAGAYERLVGPPWFERLGPGGIPARLHPLQRSVLRHEAERRLGHAEMRALGHRLALYLAERGQVAAALDQGLDAGATALALSLVDRAATEQVRMGRAGEIRRWLERFGPRLSDEAAPLLLARARLSALDGDHRAALGLAEAARVRYAAGADTDGVLSCLDLCTVDLELGPTPEALRIARAARDSGPPEASAWARLWLARLEAARGRVPAVAARRAVAAIEACLPTDRRTARARIVGDHLRYLAGSVGTIECTASQLVEGLTDQLFDYWPALLYAGRWEELEALLAEAATLPVPLWARDFVRLWLDLPRVVLLALCGEAERALALAEGIERAVLPAGTRGPSHPLELSVLAAVKSGVLVRLGRFRDAEATARANRSRLALSPTMALVAHLDLAHVLLAAGRREEAEAELMAARPLATDAGLRGLYWRTLRLALDLSGPPVETRSALLEVLREVERFGAHGFLPLYDPGPIRPAVAAMDGDALGPTLAAVVRQVLRLYQMADGHARPLAEPTAAVCLTTLGGLAWRGPGPPVLLPSRRVVELLLRLLWGEGASLRREAVAEAIWPDTPPTAQMNRFRVTLHELRRWLETVRRMGALDVSVVADRTSVRLEGWQGLRWDVVGVREAMAEARRLHAAEERRGVCQRAETALGLYGGPFLPEPVWYDPFLFEREALEREHAAFAEWAAGVLGPAEPRLPSLLAKAVRANPAQESLHRLWLESLATQGRWPEARRALQECAALLEGAVGLTVPPEWVRLVEGRR